MSNFKPHSLLLLSFILVFVCCNGPNQKSDDVPDYVNDRALLTQLLTDVHIIEAAIIQKQSDGMNANDLAQIYYDSLFAKYQMNKTRLDSSLAWYSLNPELFSLIYTDVITNLSRIESPPDEVQQQTEISEEDNLSLVR